MRWALLLAAFVALVCLVDAKPHLLEKQLAAAIDSFALNDDAKNEATAKSLSRMLLSFKALGELKNGVDLTGHSEWRDSLVDNEKLDPLGLKDFSATEFKTEAGEKIHDVVDAAQSVADSKKDFVSKLVGVATGDLTFEEAAAGQVATLSKYLNALIERETRLLEVYSKGHPDDEFSYLLEAPAQARYINKILSPFGLLDSGSLVDLTTSLQEQFCSPMVFLPRRSTGSRTVINGPAFELTLSTGGCELRHGFGKEKLPFPTVPKRAINCTGKEVSYTKIPMSIHKQDVLPEAFVSSQCRVERIFGTAYEKVLYGGGPLVRFASVDDFIDALVAKKYNLFSGLNDLIDRNLTAATLNDLKSDTKDDVMEFWGAFGPGRLLKDKKLFGGKAMKDFTLPSLLDISQTSPFGFGLGDEKVSPLSGLNLRDRVFSLSKTNVLSKLKDKLTP